MHPRPAAWGNSNKGHPEGSPRALKGGTETPKGQRLQKAKFDHLTLLPQTIHESEHNVLFLI